MLIYKKQKRDASVTQELPTATYTLLVCLFVINE